MSIPGPQTVEVPVLIVGAGPAGLALSVALSRYGVGHLLVERHRGTAHTLLTGIGGAAWADVAAQVSARVGVPIRTHVIGGREGVADPYGEWACRREVETTGCVLVRPDRHVAWRSIRYTPDSARQLPAVVERALGLPGRQA